ncbi:helix-turn-helix domain-containing protein [Mesoterricola silvestris]
MLRQNLAPAVSRHLGYSRNTLYRRMEKLGI